MQRKIIEINRELCNGCGACAKACHEGAIAMIDGKAVLTRDDYCDGLGDCLPNCPTGAIRFVVREAAAYDEAAVLENKRKKQSAQGLTITTGCPGIKAQQLNPICPMDGSPSVVPSQPSRLGQWPAQIKLAPVNAPYFNNAHLLVAADCTAFAFAAFHEQFMKNKITLIGCPKLDAVDYSEKLGQILLSNSIQSITLARMEVPCCGGLENAVKLAIKRSGKDLPLKVFTISIHGELL